MSNFMQVAGINTIAGKARQVAAAAHTDANYFKVLQNQQKIINSEMKELVDWLAIAAELQPKVIAEKERIAAVWAKHTPESGTTPSAEDVQFDPDLNAEYSHALFQIRDGYADVLFTVYGGVHLAGWNADEDLAAVCQSNVSKFDRNEEDAAKTKAKYDALNVETYQIQQTLFGQTFWITRSAKEQLFNGEMIAEGKWLKSVNFKEPTFRPSAQVDAEYAQMEATSQAAGALRQLFDVFNSKMAEVEAAHSGEGNAFADFNAETNLIERLGFEIPESVDSILKSLYFKAEADGNFTPDAAKIPQLINLVRDLTQDQRSGMPGVNMDVRPVSDESGYVITRLRLPFQVGYIDLMEPLDALYDSLRAKEQARQEELAEVREELAADSEAVAAND